MDTNDPGAGRGGKRTWRLVACFAAATLLALAFGGTTRGREGGAAEAARYEAKQLTLLTSIASGDEGRESFTEREINAYLDRLLEDNREALEGRGLQVGIENLRCDLVDRRASLFVTGRLTKIPFVLELRVTGPPEDGAEEDGAPRLRFQSVWLGRLPLVPPFKWVALGHLKRLLRGIRPEREILEHLKSLEIKQDVVRITVQPI